MTARIPSTTRVPASQTTRLRFAWTEEPGARRRRRGRSSVAVGLVLIAVMAMLSLGNQLATGVDAVKGSNAGGTNATSSDLPVLFAGLPDGPTAAELVHGKTIAMAHCDFFADSGCQPFACVVETLADQSQRLVVYGRTDAGWAVAFEYRPDPRGENFRGMLPEDLNFDGVPELTTLWDTPNGGIRTRVLCRQPVGADNDFTFVTGSACAVASLVPQVAPIACSTQIREPEPEDGVIVIAEPAGAERAFETPAAATELSELVVAPN